MGGMTIPLIISAFGAMSGASSARKAGNQAADASQAQNALLQWSKELGQQNGPDLLSNVWNLAMNPNENAYARGLTERSRQGIEAGYRPAFANALQGLSSRGLYAGGAYGSEPGRAAGALDRARGGAVANLYQTKYASQEQEQMNRLAQFSNLLAQLRGSNISAAEAYNSPMQMYAGMAQQGGQNMGNALGGIAQMYWLKDLMKKYPASTAMSSKFGVP